MVNTSRYAFLALVSLSSLSVFAQSELPASRPKVVYGIDDRKDIKEVTNPLFLKLAASTASMFPTTALSFQSFDQYKLTANTLETALKVCKEERYSQQIAAAMCSGFLVAPDQILTAGHCIEDQADCQSNVWVFDYYQHLTGTTKTISGSNVFHCKSVISRGFDTGSMMDYALIKLDRVVNNRTPLKYRTTGKVSDTASLVVIGNPSGLPTKVTDKGQIRLNADPVYFRTNLDTFGGNSGSAVFDSNTGIVEGILVRGEEDYIPDPLRLCRKINYVAVNAGRGEDVTRITNVYGLAGINAAKPTPPVEVNFEQIKGLWKQSVNPNLTLNFVVVNDQPAVISSGFSAGMKSTSSILIDPQSDLAIDVMPSSFCKMYLRPVLPNKIFYAFCAKRFSPEAYFTR